MFRKLSIILSAALMSFAIVSLPAEAQGWYGRGGFNVDARQGQLLSQIQTGLSTGRLTPREHSRLLSRFNDVAAFEARLRADGVLNPRERMLLSNRLNMLENSVRRDLYDRQFAGRGFYGPWY
jgi:hypothetical protein